jgi:PKD repeat protein
LQDKHKKNLSKILFIVILLSFTIILVGCSWLSFGLLNIFDPQAQIRVNYTGMDLEVGTIALEVYSLNEVEFIGSGFSYKYYSNNVLISDLSKTVGATFYVAPSTSPGTPGPTTTIDLLLYYQEVQDYIKLNPLITEMTCTISLIGTDGAGHSISKSVTVDLPAIQPGVDVTPPEAVIITDPTSGSGNPPLTVAFDASSSCDKRYADDTCDKEGIASYSWDFGDGTTSTAIATTHTYENAGTFIVILTVTDLFGNKGIAIKVIKVGTGVVGAVIVTTPSSATGFVPFTVGFDASGSTVSTPPITNYAWDFNGDGTTDATGVTAVHIFTTVGTYLVQLTVTDSAAKTYVAFVTVIANEAP